MHGRAISSTGGVEEEEGEDVGTAITTCPSTSTVAVVVVVVVEGFLSLTISSVEAVKDTIAANRSLHQYSLHYTRRLPAQFTLYQFTQPPQSPL